MRVVMFAAMALLIATSTPAGAWDGVMSGKISTVEVATGGNLSLRVHLDIPPNNGVCGGAYGLAYLNESDSNYQLFSSLITTAFAMSKQVVIYLIRDANGYCKIGHLTVSG